jgi:hypothetical protein
MMSTPMTLDQFLKATVAVPEPVLRAAMTAALSVEPARTPDACRRFYHRVMDELGLEGQASGGPNAYSEKNAA